MDDKIQVSKELLQELIAKMKSLMVHGMADKPMDEPESPEEEASESPADELAEGDMPTIDERDQEAKDEAPGVEAVEDHTAVVKPSPLDGETKDMTSEQDQKDALHSFLKGKQPNLPGPKMGMPPKKMGMLEIDIKTKKKMPAKPFPKKSAMGKY